jgi:hypothetical protein
MIKAKLLLALVIALSAVGAARAADDRSILTYHGAPKAETSSCLRSPSSGRAVRI